MRGPVAAVPEVGCLSDGKGVAAGRSGTPPERGAVPVENVVCLRRRGRPGRAAWNSGKAPCRGVPTRGLLTGGTESKEAEW